HGEIAFDVRRIVALDQRDAPALCRKPHGVINEPIAKDHSHVVHHVAFEDGFELQPRVSAGKVGALEKEKNGEPSDEQQKKAGDKAQKGGHKLPKADAIIRRDGRDRSGWGFGFSQSRSSLASSPTKVSKSLASRKFL